MPLFLTIYSFAPPAPPRLPSLGPPSDLNHFSSLPFIMTDRAAVPGSDRKTTVRGEHGVLSEAPAPTLSASLPQWSVAQGTALQSASNPLHCRAR